MNDDVPDGQLPPPNDSGNAAGLDGHLDSGHSQATRKLQLLQAGSFLFGVFNNEIATIAEWRDPTPLPNAPPSVLGVVSLQGRMLTVLDLQSLCDETTNRDESSHAFLVALRGDEQIALAVKAKGETLELAPKDIQRPPESGPVVTLFTLRHADQIVTVLDVKALFPAAIKGRERRQRRF